MISKQNILVSFAILALFVLSLLIIFGDKGLADLNMMKKGKDGLVAKNETLIRENIRLYHTIDRLNNDPAFIEDVARQELGVIGKNEMVVTIGKHEETVLPVKFTNFRPKE